MSDAISPARLRLFIALSLPDGVKDGIEKTQAELRRALPEDCIRWTRREQFHLTLRFLGNVEAPRAEQLADSVRGACAGFAALPLRAEGLGFFPGARSPRVIWVGVRDGREQLPLLQQAIETSVGAFTVEPGEKKFAGHVTLGRVKDLRQSAAEILQRLALGVAGRFFGEWTADKVEIIRSELSPQGLRYTTLAAIPLDAKSAA